MYNPDTLSKMAEYKRNDIHQNEAHRQLSKHNESDKQPFYASFIYSVIMSARHRFTNKRQTSIAPQRSDHLQNEAS